MEIGKRYNEGKLDWRLIKHKDLESLIKVLMFGKEKYSEANWKKGLPISDIINSLTRHLAKLEMGQDTDEESGLEETGHIMCNIYFIDWILKNKPWFDDRPNSNFSLTVKRSDGIEFRNWSYNLELQCKRHSIYVDESTVLSAFERDLTVMEVVNSYLNE